MTPNYTPAPWTLHRKDALRWIDAGPLCIAEVPEDEDGEPQEGNALLIAAAPDLLMALGMLYAETADYIRLNKLGGMDNQCMQLARAALAKAVGAA